MKNWATRLIGSILPICMLVRHDVHGQTAFGFTMPKGEKRMEIAFEEYNNLIVIPVMINKYVTLKFIVDTGVKTPILTERLYAELMGLTYLNEINLMAPGVKDTVQAYVTGGVDLTLPGGVNGKNMTMLVLKHDFLNLSEYMGEEVYGVIGYDLFERFTVAIDYDRKQLTLHRPEYFNPRKKATALSLKIKDQKPFITASVAHDNRQDSLEVMIDTGAGHAALLDFGELRNISAPKETIRTRLGQGIAGVIPGFVGRLSAIAIAAYRLDRPLVVTPLEGTYYKTIKRGAKYGTIGGELLKRFHVTFDYRSKRFYLLKSRRYHSAFEYNMSGMTLIASGDKLNVLRVHDVERGSPAAKGELHPGDIVLSINGKNLIDSSLSEINHLLRAKNGYKIKCKIERDGERYTKKFRLKRVI